MTELEARQFIEELNKLCTTYEKLCKCEIQKSVEYFYKKNNTVRFIRVRELSLKVD